MSTSRASATKGASRGVWIGELVRIQRRQKGLTQEQLAELINKDQNYVSHVETGRIQVPALETLKVLAQVLGISMADFAEAAGWDLFDEAGSELPTPLRPELENEPERAGYVLPEGRDAGTEPEIDLADPWLHFWASTGRVLSDEEKRALMEITRQILKAKGNEQPE